MFIAFKDAYLLSNIYKDTKKYCYGMKVPVDLYTIKYKGIIKDIKLEYKYNKTEINVENIDTFEMTKQLIDNGFNPLVLNMACLYNPGGGVKHGCKAQEEDLFRRSDYHIFMPKKLYPLNKDEVLYTPKVTIIKNLQYQKLNKSNQYSASIIACAAIRNPLLTMTDTENSNCKYKIRDDMEWMKFKIEQIFQTAYCHNHDSVVFGALGCGAYGNPPHIIVEMFNETIKKYNGCFRNISFAVLSKKDKNYKIFTYNLRI